MTTLDDLARVERELREIGVARGYASGAYIVGMADTISAFIKEQEQLAATFRERDAAAGWQPIETAPRDTLVLVHCQYAGEPAIARLTDAGWKLGVEHHETNCGTYCLGGSPGGYASFVTHWMPLPAAPSGTKENSDG